MKDEANSRLIFRAEKAAELLGNEALQEALDTLEKEVVEAWLACPARDAEGKEYFWQIARNTRKFRGILQGYIEGGKAARMGRPDKEKPSMVNFFRRKV